MLTTVGANDSSWRPATARAREGGYRRRSVAASHFQSSARARHSLKR